MHEISISVLKGCTDNEPRTSVTNWRTLAKYLTVSREQAHKDGPAWSPATFRGLRRKENVTLVSALVLDVDSTTRPDFETNLAGYDAVCHTTYSDKWRVVFRLSRPVSPREYTRISNAVQAELVGDCGWKGVDETCRQPERLYFQPCHQPGHTPHSYLSRGAPLPVDQILSASVAPASQAVCRASPAGEAPFQVATLRDRASGKPEFRKFVDQTLVLKQGSRDHTVTSLAGWVAKVSPRGTAWEQVAPLFEALVAKGGTEPEGPEHWFSVSREKFVRFAEQEEQSRRMDDYVAESARKHAKPVAPGETPWQDKLEKTTTKDGTIKLVSNANNLFLILENDTRLAGIRRNLTSGKFETGPECILHNRDPESHDTELSAWLHAEYRFEMKGRDVYPVLQAHASRNAYDPLMDFFGALPRWDGTPRIDTALPTYCGTLDDEHHRTVSRCFFLSAAARATRPGCQVDNVLVLQGEGGLFKTSFVRALGCGFSSEQSLAIDDKDGMMECARSWLVELPELASIKRGDMERVRAFITKRRDNFRPPYGRVIKDFPRRCIFVGTTNELEAIRDADGIRRYWPVAVGNIDVQALETVKLQLWAEAKARLEAGEQYHMTREEAARANQFASDHFAPEDTEATEFVDCYLKSRRPTDKDYTLSDFMNWLGIFDSASRSRQTRLGALAKKVGFAASVVWRDGRKQRVYAPSEALRAMAAPTRTNQPVKPVEGFADVHARA